MNWSTILITGGAGFIGSHAVRYFLDKYSSYSIYNLDKLTYAGNLENLKEVEDNKRYKFIKADINDPLSIFTLLKEVMPDVIIHFAAASHVDRSITDPNQFLETNIIGTANLLNAFRQIWDEEKLEKKLFFHISTDEVYGTLGNEGYFTEETRYDPHSPYAASKAASDHIVRSFGETYKIPYVITNCSNNYGPNQFPEKLIPLVINNIKNELPIPVYGKGENVRDWLWVKDHINAIDTILHNGQKNSTYNIGGQNEWKNIDLINLLCIIMDEKLKKPLGSSASLIRFVKDRAAHDYRYAINATKLKDELNWEPSLQFEEGLRKTVDWYLENENWLENVTDGSYQKYYNAQYNNK